MLQDLNSSFRKILLCELLSGQRPDYVRARLLAAGEEPLRFNPTQCAVLVTGFPKHVYTGIYGLSVEQYMQIYWQFQHQMHAYLEKAGLDHEIIMYIYSPQKEIALLYSPRPACTTSAYSVAEYAANLLNDIAHRDFIDARCQNFSVLTRVGTHTPPLADLFETMLHQRRLSFFDMRLVVADERYFACARPAVSSGSIHQAAQKIALAVRVLDKAALRARLDALFLDTLKPVFDFSALEDALFQLRLLYEKFAEVYLPEKAAENKAKFKPAKHLCIEALNDWLFEVFGELIDRIAANGEHLSLVAQRAVGIILREYGNPSLSLNYLARQIGVSPSYLSRVFNRELGQSVPKTIEDTRLRQARTLMDETALSVAEIAAKVGFSDARYFSRIFREHHGVSPSAYCSRQGKDAPSVNFADGAVKLSMSSSAKKEWRGFPSATAKRF